MIKLTRLGLLTGATIVLGAGTVLGQTSRPGGRQCRSLSLPKKLPTVDQVVDSAALVGLLPRGSGGTFLFSLTGGSGRPLAARPIEDRGVQVSDSVTGLVVAALRGGAAVDPAVRLRVSTDPEPSISIERSILCPPAAPSSHSIGRVSVTTTTPPPDRVRTPRIRFRITVDGIVAEADLQSSSGVPELDRELLRLATTEVFQPALLDGKPVEVWFENGRAEIVR